MSCDCYDHSAVKIPKVFDTHGLKTPVFSSGNNIPRMMRQPHAVRQYNLGTTNTDFKMFGIEKIFGSSTSRMFLCR